MSLIRCSKASVFISVLLMLLHRSIQQGPPTKPDFEAQTCTTYIESLIGPKEIRTPRRVEVSFKVFNRNNTIGADLPEASRRLYSYRHFNPTKNTKFIIHGFLSRATASWIVALTRGLLMREDCNVITVNWSREAGSPYERAVLRAYLVGDKISRLIRSLIEVKGADPAKMHLIGLSLGAQIAGIAGHKIPKFGRITGLDPAAPMFLNVSESKRLDPSDAKFVDVIHTNADCLGAGWPCGHIDFYPNGGANQPGCRKVDYINKDVRNVVTQAICSHQRSADLFVESVLSNNENQFLGMMANSYKDFLEKLKSKKEAEICPMGINADKCHKKGKPSDKPRLFYLTTNERMPFGGYHDLKQAI